MRRVFKWFGIAIGAMVALVFVILAVQVALFERSMSKTYNVPVPIVQRSTDPIVLARGEHLAHTLASCATTDCHGNDLSGGKPTDGGPLGLFAAPNITPAGRAAQYSDGEIMRLVQHGIKRDGRGVLFMTAHEIGWLPPEDITAVISWMRTVPAVNKPDGPVKMGVLGMVLDRFGLITFDPARRIDHDHPASPPKPEPTARYGAYISRTCSGCHGERFSGGPIPGAPSTMPVPLNLTPHETGLKSWTYADFERVLDTGTRPDGRKLDPFMPFEALSKMDQTERKALWAFLQGLEPRAFGQH